MGETLYSSCGVLGFGAKEMTKADFRSRGYKLDGVYDSCGIFGLFFTKKATYANLPVAWRDCTPPGTGTDGTYMLDGSGQCMGSCSGKSIKSPTSFECVTPGDPCTNPKQPSKSFVYDKDGICDAEKCSTGFVSTPPNNAGSLGRTTCPIGYKRVESAEACSTLMSSTPSLSNVLTDHTTFKDPSFATTQPPGCFVYPADGLMHGKKVDKGVFFNPSATGKANPESFVLCELAQPQCTIKEGTACRYKDQSNFTWNTEGECVGSCFIHSCEASQRCCAGKCYSDADLVNGQCPNYAKTQKDIKKVGAFLDSAIAAVK